MELIYQIIVVLLMILCSIFIVGTDDKDIRNVMAAVLIACVFSFPLTLIF